MKNNLKALRGERSQEEIGRALDLGASSISQYESGKTELTPEMILKFAKALKVPPDKIEVSDEDSLKEEGPGGYRTGTVLLRLLLDKTLQVIYEDLRERAFGSPEMTAAMHEISVEVTRRRNRTAERELIIHRKRAADPSSILTPEEKRAGAAYLDHAAGEASGPSDSGESGLSSGAGAPPPHKPKQHAPSSQVSKSPPAAREGKERT